MRSGQVFEPAWPGQLRFMPRQHDLCRGRNCLFRLWSWASPQLRTHRVYGLPTRLHSRRRGLQRVRCWKKSGCQCVRVMRRWNIFHRGPDGMHRLYRRKILQPEHGQDRLSALCHWEIFIDTPVYDVSRLCGRKTFPGPPVFGVCQLWRRKVRTDYWFVPVFLLRGRQIRNEWRKHLCQLRARPEIRPRSRRV